MMFRICSKLKIFWASIGIELDILSLQQDLASADHRSAPTTSRPNFPGAQDAVNEMEKDNGEGIRQDINELEIVVKGPTYPQIIKSSLANTV